MHRAPNEQELKLLRLISDRHGSMCHDDEALNEFCDDASTMTHPDVFNMCHDLEWLQSGHDDRTDTSTVHLTKAGRAALAAHNA